MWPIISGTFTSFKNYFEGHSNEDYIFHDLHFHVLSK